MDALPVLETERLRLRKLKASDIPRIVEYANNPKVEEMTLNIPHPYHEEDAIRWINMGNEGLKDDSHFIFAICLKTDDEFMGGVGLNVNKRFNRAELGFWLGEPFWDNGYMSEATGKVLSFGFEEINLNKIMANHLPKNPASGKVMEKNGMIKEGQLKEHIRKDETYFDLIQFGLTKKDYEKLSE